MRFLLYATVFLYYLRRHDDRLPRWRGALSISAL
jgi:hypothetical protein